MRLSQQQKDTLIQALTSPKGFVYYDGLPLTREDHGANRTIQALEDKGLLRHVAKSGSTWSYAHALTAQGRREAMAAFNERERETTKMLMGIRHHDAAVKPAFKLPASLMRQIEVELARRGL